MTLSKSACTLLPLYVLAFLSNVVCSQLVPVYMWETTKTNERVSAITHINADTFTEILFEKIEKTNPFIVVFAEENLSPEDFIEQHKKIFPHMSKFAASSQVTYLPLVEDPLETIKNLPSKEYSEVSVTDLTNKALPNSGVVIVNLNDASDDEDRSDMLRRHDSIINEVYTEIVKQHEQVLVMFTGYHSSWIVPEQIKTQRQSRSLREDEPEVAETRQFLSDGEFMMFLKDSILHKTTIEDNTTTQYYKIKDLTETNKIVSITTNTSAAYVFLFTVDMDKAGYWFLTKVTIKGKENDTDISLDNVYAPVSFSYHCDHTVFTVSDTESYTFRGMQIQYGKENSTSFDDAYDCVGFTTAPIWSGLFVTFILALIMTLGLTMMMDIKTMDRFDDPKGKTIIINASE